jgi:hypothetical protein
MLDRWGNIGKPGWPVTVYAANVIGQIDEHLGATAETNAKPGIRAVE